MKNKKTTISLSLLVACGTLLAGCGQTFADCFTIPSGLVMVSEEEANYVSNIVTKNLKYITGYNQYTKEEESNEYFKGTSFEDSTLEFGTNEYCIEANNNARFYNNCVFENKTTANYKIEYAGKNMGISMTGGSLAYVKKSNKDITPDAYDLYMHDYSKINGEISGVKETEENYISQTDFANDENDLPMQWDSYKISQLEIDTIPTSDFYKYGDDYYAYKRANSKEQKDNPIAPEDKTRTLVVQNLTELIIKIKKDAKKGYILASYAKVNRSTLDVDINGNLLEKPITLTEQKDAKIFLYDDNGDYEVPEYSVDKERSEFYVTIFNHETGELISSMHSHLFEDEGVNENPSLHTYSRIIELSNSYDYSFYLEGYDGNDQYKWEDLTAINVPDGLLENSNGHIHPTETFNALVEIVIDEDQNVISFTISLIYGNIN